MQKVQNKSKTKAKDKYAITGKLIAIRHAKTGSEIDNKKYSLKCIDGLQATSGKLPDGEAADPWIVEVATKRAQRIPLDVRLTQVVREYEVLATAMEEKIHELDTIVNKIVYDTTLPTNDMCREHDNQQLFVQEEARSAISALWTRPAPSCRPQQTATDKISGAKWYLRQ